MSVWTTRDIPSQTGTLAVITGTGGLGYETALVLAQKGAEVIVAGRNDAKGRTAIEKIQSLHPGAKVRFERVDLASLASVATFADRLTSEGRGIDLLINNAGVMALATRQTTADGFEMQLGTNYLGHFALTAQVLPLLRQASHPRVVELSSGAHHRGAIHFDDLQLVRSYSAWKAYAQSKLAMLMFALELQRQSDANGWGLMSNAAHPGFARTDLIANGPAANRRGGLLMRVQELISPLISQSATAGALPTLYAATSPNAQPGGYYGPDGLAEMRGAPKVARIAAQAQDKVAAARLWQVSEQLTGVTFDMPVAV